MKDHFETNCVNKTECSIDLTGFVSDKSNDQNGCLNH